MDSRRAAREVRSDYGAAQKVSTHEAKTHLSRLLARVAGGETFVIARSGSPVARLVPFRPSPKSRRPGTARGAVRIAEDFNAPLPARFLKTFET